MGAGWSVFEADCQVVGALHAADLGTAGQPTGPPYLILKMWLAVEEVIRLHPDKWGGSGNNDDSNNYYYDEQLLTIRPSV